MAQEERIERQKHEFNSVSMNNMQSNLLQTNQSFRGRGRNSQRGGRFHNNNFRGKEEDNIGASVLTYLVLSYVIIFIQQIFCL